jgi:hypothetical protein
VTPIPPCSWHALLTDEAHRVAELHLRLRQRAAALRRGLSELEAREVAHRARELELHLHVGDAVAQRLEGRDRHAELLARVHVLDRQRDQLVHRADASAQAAAMPMSSACSSARSRRRRRAASPGVREAAARPRGAVLRR